MPGVSLTFPYLASTLKHSPRRNVIFYPAPFHQRVACVTMHAGRIAKNFLSEKLVMRRHCSLFVLAIAILFTNLPLALAAKKVVFVAGKPSHGYGAHEHNAGCTLLAKSLQLGMKDFVAEVHRNGWPADPKAAFEGADAIVMYCDGGGGHMVNQHLEEVD